MDLDGSGQGCCHWRNSTHTWRYRPVRNVWLGDFGRTGLCCQHFRQPISRITDSCRFLVTVAVAGLQLGWERPFIDWQILSPFPTRQCLPDVLSCSYMMEVFLEMLGWTLPKLHVRALWGDVWQGHRAYGTLSRPGRFQCWQKLPQRDEDLLRSGDRRRTVWTWRSPFGPQH